MSFFDRLFRKRTSDPVRLAQPRVEALEDRLVPSAATVDLTFRGAAGEINSALFRQVDTQPTGTGVINSFVRLQANGKGGIEQGYNTDARSLEFDENKSPQFTRSLKLGEVPTVRVEGQLYREFLLDVNQKSSEPLISLDQLRLYVADVSNLRGYDASTGQLAGNAPVYDLDAGGDHWVKIDYRLNSGSGSGDVVVLIPDAVFRGGSASSYVYLYSKFGENLAANAGFEEWAVGLSPLTPSEPPPATIAGTVFFDLNQDGVRNVEAGEGPMAGWFVYLDLDGNGTRDANEPAVQTQDDGTFVFDNLDPADGPFILRLEPQENFEQSTSDPNPVDLLPGETFTFDFGVVEQVLALA